MFDFVHNRLAVVALACVIALIASVPTIHEERGASHAVRVAMDQVISTSGESPGASMRGCLESLAQYGLHVPIARDILRARAEGKLRPVTDATLQELVERYIGFCEETLEDPNSLSV